MPNILRMAEAACTAEADNIIAPEDLTSTVWAGDIYPQTPVETVIGLIIISVGLVFFGLLLGSIASSLQVRSI